MFEKELKILEKLIQDTGKRKNRLETFLRPRQGSNGDGWYMSVPEWFNDALDIKLTERVKNKKKTYAWTQGSFFAFKLGDIIYRSDVRKSSEGLLVQVDEAIAAGPIEGTGKRFPGKVQFTIHVNYEPHPPRVTMSQDDFVRFLILGPNGDLKEKLQKICSYESVSNGGDPCPNQLKHNF